MSKITLRIFNKSETKYIDFRLKEMDGFRPALNFLANNGIPFVVHGGEADEDIHNTKNTQKSNKAVQ